MAEQLGTFPAIKSLFILVLWDFLVILMNDEVNVITSSL
jgi:hypothetical protein